MTKDILIEIWAFILIFEITTEYLAANMCVHLSDPLLTLTSSLFSYTVSILLFVIIMSYAV